MRLCFLQIFRLYSLRIYLIGDRQITDDQLNEKAKETKQILLRLRLIQQKLNSSESSS